MKNIKEFAEEGLEYIVPAAKNAGGHIYVVCKNAKDGFINNRNRIKNYMSNKENKNRVLDILLIILSVLAALAIIVEIYDSILKIKERKHRIKSKKK